jgi:hypothetical protein
VLEVLDGAWIFVRITYDEAILIWMDLYNETFVLPARISIKLN